MTRVSITDQPIGSRFYETIEETLGLGDYARGLASFITMCDTPLTIGVQGEWGSGKTSLLNLVCNDLVKAEVRRVGSGNKPVPGNLFFKLIWLNTWEHSLLRTPEECLISILSDLVDEISKIDGRYEAANRAKSALKSLAVGAVRIGASMTVGSAGERAVDDLLNSGSGVNTVKALRQTLDDAVQNIVSSKNQSVEKIVVVIDDLDRLDPEIAVAVIELLKNIFDIKNCVFVLAIDYQVVVKGLKKKFGDPTEANEWEFRSFFDKIIQVPFMMPVSQYKLEDYVIDLLAKTSFLSSQKEQDIARGGIISTLVGQTIGHNPRALKRLVNSLSLIWSFHAKQDEINIWQFKLTLFAFVCLQISMPRLFDLIRISPRFYDWDDDMFVRSVDLESINRQEVERALDHVKIRFEDDFDEPWEEILFKIIWANGWQRSRIVDASRVLSVIKDNILSSLGEDLQEKILIASVKMASITSVTATDSNYVATDDANQHELEEQRRVASYWAEFRNRLQGTGCVFDGRISTTRSTPHLWRRSEIAFKDNLSFAVDTKTNFVVKIAAVGHAADLERELFEKIGLSIEILKELFNAEFKVKISETSSSHSLTIRIADIPKRKDLLHADNLLYKDRHLQWLSINMKNLEVWLSSIEVSGFNTLKKSE